MDGKFEPDANYAAMQIQLRSKPSTWPDEIAKLPEHLREGAETYLRGIAARMRYLRDNPQLRRDP